MNARTERAPRTIPDRLPEVVTVVSGDNADAQRISRLHRAGLLRALYRGVYSSNLRADDEDVVLRNWRLILAYLAPGAVISHRSAVDMKPVNGTLWISRSNGSRELELPGLKFKGMVRPERGAIVHAARDGARDVDYRGIYVASTARAYLESLTADKRLAPRQLGREEIENALERILTLRGEPGLNNFRDDARDVAHHLKMPAEFKVLDGLTGALLGSHPVKNLGSARAVARARGQPYDAERIELFDRVAAQLRAFPFSDLAEPARQGAARNMFAFVEGYFSNYIEGTTFTLEEAEEIVFQGRLVLNRDEDSHDIKGTFEAAQRDPFYSQLPADPAGFLQWLQGANSLVMQARLDRNPGQWKDKNNQAGSTLFVPPELVPETLRRAWLLFDTLAHPMQQALMAMFVVSEIHPFADGNGRTARLMMNCFLSAQAHCRIIVPTVFRDDYLLSLKSLTNEGDATAYIRALRLCQAWSFQLSFDVAFEKMNEQLETTNAKREEARLYRLLSPTTGRPMSVP